MQARDMHAMPGSYGWHHSTGSSPMYYEMSKYLSVTHLDRNSYAPAALRHGHGCKHSPQAVRLCHEVAEKRGTTVKTTCVLHLVTVCDIADECGFSQATFTCTCTGRSGNFDYGRRYWARGMQTSRCELAHQEPDSLHMCQ